MTIYKDKTMRTIVQIPEEQLKALSYICKKKHISRAEAIRQSIELYVKNTKASHVDEAFGLWKERKINSLDYQNKLRDEWK